jgi:hypothetical protein
MNDENERFEDELKGIRCSGRGLPEWWFECYRELSTL